MTPGEFERFEAKYVPVPYSGCWLWDAGTTNGGYGAMWSRGQMRRAHVLSYEHHVGPVPRGMVVRHSCDVPCCVNPVHLLVGTHADNARDKVERNRLVVGERVHNSKLTPEAVLEIRHRAKLGLGTMALASMFGVSAPTICDIKARRTWAHVEDK